ncbi:phage tail-collar fiber domain-containing protein [Pseudomonas corrugata]|uniref:phage tail-collar fiber domain-containing protein n=1 Tax=Pseudomonas corrugata TaxID=47879 RepID=UPI003D813595
MTDQNSQFFATLTSIGRAKQANADALGIPWTFAQMGVGDANGTDPIPDEQQTHLINERRRAPLNQLSVDPANPNVIVAEQVIPESVGGWWIREVGLYDADGDLVAVANCAPSFKPLLTQGSGRTQVVRMNLIVSNTTNVELKIDPSVVLATRTYVDTKIRDEINKLDSKQSVRVATTANIALTGLQVLDGVTLLAGDRVLVKNQTAPKDNGIYIVAANGAWPRSGDADSGIEIQPGLCVHVEQGTVNADSFWQLATDNPIVLGTTALTFIPALGKTGVAAGTYKQVVVDVFGRITSGSNPTTLGGYGISDAFTKTESAAAIQAAVAALVDSSPAALDTLNELATALGDDPNFAATMTAALAGKAAKSTSLAGYGIVDAYTKGEQDVARAVANVDTLRINGSYFVVAGTLGTLPIPGLLGTLLHQERGSSNGRWQLFSGSNGRLYYRWASYGDGAWSAWDPMVTESTYDSLATSTAGYLYGLTMANQAAAPTTTVTVSPGVARSTGNDATITLPASMAGVLQTAGAWAAVSGGNKLDTGARAANAWYHLFVIKKASDGTGNLLFSLSASAPTLPAGYGSFRRIGAVKTDGSGNIIPFINVGREFYFSTAMKDVASSTPASSTGSAGSATLTLSAPSGVRVNLKGHVAMSCIGAFVHIRPTDSNAVTMAFVTGAIPAWQAGIGANTSDVDYLAFPFECLTDVSSAVVMQWAMASSGGTGYYAVTTLGYTELN